MNSVPQRPTDAILDAMTADVIATWLKAEQPTNVSLHRALDKAVSRMRKGCAWTLRDNTLEVQSESQPWHMHTCTIAACECPCQAGVCHHRALAAIVITASTLRAAAAACVPLQAAPRRKRVAEPRYDVDYFQRRREQDRVRVRHMSQAELEADVNAGIF